MHELILGGGKRGKSCRAELRAKDWLQVSGQCALMIATARPGDDEMRERISRYGEQRALHVPDLQTLKLPHALPAALREWCAPRRLVIGSGLNVCLAQPLMPMLGPRLDEQAWHQQEADLGDALGNAARPVVPVCDEIGINVAALGREVRRHLDALRRLHQRLAIFCERVTLMVTGIEMTVKE